MMYEYRGHLIHVVDGDTVHAEVDLGCDIRVQMTLRLAHVDCPEHGTEPGDAATAYTKHWFEIQCPDDEFVLNTLKDRREKYGRYLAEIWSVGKKSLNKMLVDSGHAKAYEGGKKSV